MPNAAGPTAGESVGNERFLSILSLAWPELCAVILLVDYWRLPCLSREDDPVGAELICLTREVIHHQVLLLLVLGMNGALRDELTPAVQPREGVVVAILEQHA